MNEIIPVFLPETVKEARLLPDIEGMVASLHDFFAETSLTDGRRTASFDACDIPSLGFHDLRKLELLMTGRFRLDGDLYVICEGGLFFNVDGLIRRMREAL